MSLPTVVTFLAFIGLGLPDGVLGVAWPSIRSTFELPISQLGVLLAALMAGYLVSTISSGELVRWLGVGPLLAWSGALVTVSLSAYAVAPAWPIVIASGVVAGLGAGAIDAGINAYAARRFTPTVVSWLHASYGVGAMLGPLLMTAVLSGGLGWRGGYAVLAAMLAGMTACFLATSDRWSVEAPAPKRDSGSRAPGMFAGLQRLPVWLNIALFFLYTGLEATAGQWTYSLFTEARGVPPVLAGTWVSAYWGALAGGRIISGFVTARVGAERVLTASMASAPLAAAVIWWAPLPSLGLIGLAWLGLAFAPIYPLLISQTPHRLGSRYAAHAIGFQVGAAYIGAAAIPGVTGLLAHWDDLEVVGAVLFLASTVLWGLYRLPLTPPVGTTACTESPPSVI